MKRTNSCLLATARLPGCKTMLQLRRQQHETVGGQSGASSRKEVNSKEHGAGDARDVLRRCGQAGAKTDVSRQ